MSRVSGETVLECGDGPWWGNLDKLRSMADCKKLCQLIGHTGSITTSQILLYLLNLPWAKPDRQ